MDRLTFEINEEGVFVKKSDVGIWLVKDGILYTDAIRKLAEYENLEEQGRLLELPYALMIQFIILMILHLLKKCQSKVEYLDLELLGVGQLSYILQLILMIKGVWQTEKAT